MDKMHTIITFEAFLISMYVHVIQIRIVEIITLHKVQ